MPFNFIRIYILFLVLFLSTASCTRAEIKLPQLISNRMVLQRDKEVNIWGWADVGERIQLSFSGVKKSTTTGKDGKWTIVLPAMRAGGPFVMTLVGSNTITLTDILIGDVWFCAGQSNMVLPMERLKENYPEEVQNDDFPEIRNFFVPTKADVTKVYPDLPKGEWKMARAQGLMEFGGVSYFFAKKLYQKYKVPIGIINASVGGTPIEAWMSADAFEGFPAVKAQIETFRDTAYMNKLSKQASNYPTRKPPYTNVPNTWHQFWMPGYWTDQGVKNLNGILHFQKEIHVPTSMTGVPAKLFMGRIIDADSTFVNGVYVGHITYQYPPRRYNVPAHVLKPGKNTVLVKVTNTSGKGGFVPEKNYALQANGQTIDLRGAWTYRVMEVFPKLNGALGAPNPPQPIVAQNAATGLYNTMVAPATPYGIKGFLWYQGETNAGAPQDYAQLLPALINDWRAKWGMGNQPFLFVQLPNFMEVDYALGESNWAQMRQSQLQTLKVNNTGMAVGIDVGEWNDIHPLNKKPIGERLALWAERLAYGDKKVVCSGPIYRSATKEGNQITLSFDYVGSGLIAKDETRLYHFAIAGADRKYVWAQAKIEGDQVVVWSDQVLNPVSVRYAWADNPRSANLYNVDGLPASPFEAVIK